MKLQSVCKIHFVSYGHVFRSRLAEAYLRFLLRKHKGVQISSSGIKYDKDINGPIAWYTMKILVDHQLVPYMSENPTVTTSEMLKESDAVIFLDDISKDYCKRRLGFSGKNYDAWNVEYLPPDKTNPMTDLDRDIYIIKRSEQIFKNIVAYCHRFTADLSETDIPFSSSMRTPLI